MTAADVAFSLNVLKEKGHPIYAQLLREVESANAEGDDVVHVRFVEGRSRDAHLIVVGMPVFSAAWWKGRDFTAATLDPPLGSGAYKVKTFEQGRFIEYARDPNYWGAKLPVNLGQNNFDRLRFEYYRERQVAFEAFKAGAINYHEEYTSRFWATSYDFPAVKDGRVKKETLHDGAPSRTQGWYLNTRRDQFKDPRVREAIGLCFDFEWTNKNIMYSAYKRIVSYFPNTDMEAKGKPGPDELKLLEPFRDKLAPAVFDEPYVPPESDGSGSDRKLLKQAYDLLLAAGCKRDGSAMKLPDGKPLTIEFLDSNPALQPHTMPFIQNLGKLGIQGDIRIVDPAQYKSRTDAFDFDVVTTASGGTFTPGSTSATSTRRSPRSRTPRAISPASPIPSWTRWSKRSLRPNRAASSTPPAARSTASCAPAIIGSRCGIATPRGSPIGTPFPGPSVSPSSASARPAPGGGTKRRPRPLDFKRRLTRRLAKTG